MKEHCVRWMKQIEWGTTRLNQEQWAPLSAEITAENLEAVEGALEEITGFMDPFREDVDGVPLVGVSDGQLAISHETVRNTWGQKILLVRLYAAGPVGVSTPDAFERLAKAAGALVDQLQSEGISVESIRWRQLPYISRPF